MKERSGTKWWKSQCKLQICDKKHKVKDSLNETKINECKRYKAEPNLNYYIHYDPQSQQDIWKLK